MKIEFDLLKDEANCVKHGVSLAFGAEILADANRLDVLDTRFNYAEERFVCYGLVKNRVGFAYIPFAKKFVASSA